MYRVGRPLFTNVRRLKFSGFAAQVLIYKSWRFWPPSVSRKWSTNPVHYFCQFWILNSFFLRWPKMYGVGRPLSSNVRRLKFSGFTAQVLIYKSWKFQPPNVSRKWSTNAIHYFCQFLILNSFFTLTQNVWGW